MTWRRLWTVTVAALLVVSSFGVLTVGETAATTDESGGIASEENVALDVRVEWDSETPDRVGYVYSFDASADSSFALRIDEELDAVRGFTENADGYWEYDPSADVHRVTVTQSVNESATHHDWVYSADSGVFVGAPHLDVRWVANGDRYEKNPLEADYANVDVGYGNHSGFRVWERIYVGPYTTYATEHDGQTYTVYRPELADDAGYERAVRSLVATADRTPVSEPPATVDIAVFPTGKEFRTTVHTYSGSEWAGRAGGQSEGDAIVESDSQVDSYNNVWAHEFVHLEQGYDDGSETDWLREAQATYHTAASMHAVGCGNGDLEGYLAADSATRDDTLSDPDTWSSSHTPYEKGTATLSDFAARLHAQTGGETTVEDVFRTMEDADVDTHAAFVAHVNETVGNQSLNERNANYLDRYVATGDYSDDVDHPPMDRASSCLANYQHVGVTVTSYDGDGSTPSPTGSTTGRAGSAAAR